MKKNSKENRNPAPVQKKSMKKGPEQKHKKKKKDKGVLEGFTTLNQVAGVPKPHAFHSQIPVNPVYCVREPKPVCALCGNTIENIAQAFNDAEGRPVHFDCVLEKIKSSEILSENQFISYVGKGNFAVVEKLEDGKYIIVRTISYEDQKRNSDFKAYVESLKG